MSFPDLLPSLPALVAFVSASLALAIAPGPGVLYVVTRSLAEGRRSGVASVAGVAIGNFANALVAAAGLAAVLAVSTAAFLAVKYVGALYLVYLGIQALLARPLRAREVAARAASPRRAFGDGAIVALFNPKTALFFAAFLPPFAEEAAGIAQSIALGGIFVAIAATKNLLYALTAARLGSAVSERRSLAVAGKYLAGGTYIGLGLATAFGGERSPSR